MTPIRAELHRMKELLLKNKSTLIENIGYKNDSTSHFIAKKEFEAGYNAGEKESSTLLSALEIALDALDKMPCQELYWISNNVQKVEHSSNCEKCQAKQKITKLLLGE